jgi:hypothetical protein
MQTHHSPRLTTLNIGWALLARFQRGFVAPAISEVQSSEKSLENL